MVIRLKKGDLIDILAPSSFVDEEDNLKVKVGSGSLSEITGSSFNRSVDGSLENDGMAELDFPYSSGIYIMQLTIGETSIVKKILK